MIHLSDAALQDFIIRGYRLVQPNATADLHGELHRQVERVLATGNLGNNLIDRVPLLHQLFADPAIDAALTGILGPGYALHRHCHCHDLAPGNQAQAWHKDYPFGGNVRYHRPRYALLLYYPHEVTPDMGPTALVPGTQYYMDGPGDEVAGLALTCAAGTVVITHYELWHRATANRSTRTRYMLKFLFARTEESRPEQRSKWMPTGRHATLYRTLWRWYGGQAPALRPQRSVEALQAALQDPDERVRLDAYYDLGALGVEGVPVLMAALKDESARCWQANIGRGDFTNPSQLESPLRAGRGRRCGRARAHRGIAGSGVVAARRGGQRLGLHGYRSSGGSALAAALQDDSEWVCRNAADSLGNMGRVPAVVPALAHALDDSRAMTPWSLSDAPLRENAAMTLAKWRAPDAAVVALQRACQQGNEYVRSWAEWALDRRF